MARNEFLLSEFWKTLLRSTHEKIVNLDSAFVHDFDFHAERLERVFEITPNKSIPPNRWSYHRIVLVTEGSGEFMTGIYKFKASKNTIVVIPSRLITSSKNWTDEIAGYVALFNLDFFLQNNFPRQNLDNKTILNQVGRPYAQITDKEAAELAGIFETLLRESTSDHKNKKELLAVKILELLIISERLFSDANNFDGPPSSMTIIRKFVELLDINYLGSRSVKFYADQLAVHPNYLNTLIKKHTGLTAKETIRNRILEETKYLLHSTNLSIKEISNQLGFRDPNYFTFFFKQFEGVPPANYRSSNL
jgi:AraC family transcriptional regulator, transcriptional activator of pobA